MPGDRDRFTLSTLRGVDLRYGLIHGTSDKARIIENIDLRRARLDGMAMRHVTLVSGSTLQRIKMLV